MSAVFLDTGYLIAIEAADDQNHAAADQHWNSYRKALRPLLTSSFVLMQQHGITEALTFDQHFVQAGFQKLP